MGRSRATYELSVAPARLTVRQCIPETVELGITNRSDQPGFADVYVTVPSALTSSFRVISTYVPARRTVTVDVRISAPPGAPPGDYGVGFATGRRERLTVPVTVTAEAGTQCMPRERMTATASSAQLPAYGPQNAIDGAEGTIWHTRYSPTVDALPQSITLELGAATDVRELLYQPRIGNRNGIITAYEVAASADGRTFATVASGTWAADASRKTVVFSAAGARFIRLTAVAGVGGFASAAELVLFGRAQ